MTRRALSVLALLGAVLAPAVAGAEEAPSPTPPPELERRGVVIGFGVGAGVLEPKRDSAEIPDSRSGVAVELRVGSMLTSNLALLVILPMTLARGGDDVDSSQVGYTVGVRFFATRVFWLEGGVGAGRYIERVDDGFDEYTRFELTRGRMLLAGAGVDLFQGEAFAVSFELELTGTAYGEDRWVTTYGGLLGLTWY